MCKFRSQDSHHSPWEGLPPMAPWHHVGVTMEITLDKNGSLYDPAGTESWNMQIRLVRYLDKDEIIYINIYIYIYMGLWWPPAASYNCAQVRHHSPAGTFTRVPGRCLRWSPTSQGPRWPPANICILIEVLHLYRCVTHTHHLSLSHTIFHIQLCHTQLCFTSILHHLLPSPSLLQHFLLIIGRSWLVGLSGPLINYSCYYLCVAHFPAVLSPIIVWGGSRMVVARPSYKKSNPENLQILKNKTLA